MRRLLILLLFLAPVAQAQQGATCNPDSQLPLSSFASETLTVSSTALPLTKATWSPSGGQAATAAYMTVKTDNVLFWLDGSTPTATVGHVFAAGGSLVICGPDLAKFRVIRQTNDATLSITYLRPQAIP